MTNFLMQTLGFLIQTLGFALVTGLILFFWIAGGG
jgi:hypothetical protein